MILTSWDIQVPPDTTTTLQLSGTPPGHCLDSVAWTLDAPPPERSWRFGRSKTSPTNETSGFCRWFTGEGRWKQNRKLEHSGPIHLTTMANPFEKQILQTKKKNEGHIIHGEKTMWTKILAHKTNYLVISHQTGKPENHRLKSAGRDEIYYYISVPWRVSLSDLQYIPGKKNITFQGFHASSFAESRFWNPRFR